MNGLRRRITMLILPAILLLMTGKNEAAEVKATVPYQKIGDQDQLELTVRVSGDESQGVDFIDLPPLEGFDVVSTSQRTSVNIMNGMTTSSKDFVFTLLPKKQGTFTIPSISIDVGGRTLKTEPIEVTVSQGSLLGSRRRSRPDPWADPFFGRSRRRSEQEPIGDNIFVRAEVSRDDLFYGEQLTLTYKLYTRYNIRGIDMSQPSLTGFWVEPIELPAHLKPEVKTINNKEYYIFTVRQNALFPSTAGELVIDPVTFTVDAEIPSSDPFFGSFFGETERVYCKTQPINVNVRALPQKGKPADFSGAVGDFKLSAEMDKQTAKVNDAMNLKITIQGQGNLKAVKKPELSEHPDFKIFDSKETSDIGFKSGVMQGHKSWEYVLMPTAAGAHILEPIRFSFFDPRSSSYKTLSSAALTLQINPADEAEEISVTQLPDGRVVKSRHVDIHYIKPAPDHLKNENEHLFPKSGFILIALLPIFLNAGGLIYRKKRDRRSRDYAGYRFRRARKKAGRFLKEANLLLKRGEKDRFSETLSKGLYAYLSDKLNLSASGLTLSEVENVLKKKNISPVTIDELKTQFEQLDMSRFGRHDMNEAEMENLFRSSQNLILKVEKEYE